MITNYIMRVVERRKVTYKLYPNATQAALLANLLRHHQQLYNAALQERADAWRLRRLPISYEGQCAGLAELRRDPQWCVANSSSEQVTLRRVKKAFEAFFRRCKAGKEPGYPRFKSVKRYSGFGYKEHGNGWRFTPGPDWEHGKLRLQHVGIIKARGEARQGGKIKSCELMHKAGAWHLFLTLECDEIERTAGNAACGMDWGTESFLTLAHPDGSHEKIANPRLYRTQNPRELELERIRDRRKRGSKRRYRAVVRCARLKAKNARRRLDFHHKESAKLIKRFALVATEKLQIRNLTRTAKGTVDKPGKNVRQKAGLNREILDTAPARFLNLMRYKAAEARSLFMEAPTRKLKPSQTCPACGRIQKKTLKKRIHSCPDCDHTEPRDAASARVCLNWAMQQLTGRGPADAV
jgi:putative transposase